MVRMFFYGVFITALVLFCMTASTAQNETHPFGFSVNEQQKSEINKRLALASTYIRTKSWEKLYELEWHDPDQCVSKKTFVAEMNVEPPETDRIRVFVDFQPSGYIGIAGQKDSETVMVTGCMVVKEHGEELSYRGSVDIGRRGSSEWLLLNLPIINPNYLAGGPDRCPQ